MTSDVRNHLAAAAILLLGACAGDIGTGGSAGSQPSRVGPEQDLAAALDSESFAFRQSGDAFRAAGATHDAVVEAGHIRLTPYHWDGQSTLTSAPIAFSTTSI